MKINNKKASIFVYLLILINIALVIGYIVYNNTFILNNSITVGKNSEELFSFILDKGNVAIDSVRQYNSNGGGFNDFISCPQNITMSGSTYMEEYISSELNYNFGSIYCSFDYNGDEVRLFFDQNTTLFTNAYYNGEIRYISNNIFEKGNSLPLSVSNSTTRYSFLRDSSNSLNDNSNEYWSIRTSNSYIEYELSSPTKLYSIELYKTTKSSAYWNQGNISFYNSSRDLLFSSSLSGMAGKTFEEINIPFSSYTNSDDIRYIRIDSFGNNHILDIRYIRAFGLNILGGENYSIDSNFTPDDTYLFFDNIGLGGGSNIDDNMNSDNYRSTSTGSISYPGDFLDDDIVPRLTFFGSVAPNSTDFHNIFWNNHITNDMVDGNFHNDDDPLLVAKIGDVTNGFLFLDVFTFDGELDYDIKIIQFDRSAYRDRFTLLPIAVYETLNVNQNYGYMQLNGNTISLSPYKTGNEFEFNFAENDYSIYLTNRAGENLAYKLTGEERPNDWIGSPTSWNLDSKGREIYINPIDDSKPGVIEVVSNHIIAGGEKNYIGENFLMVGPK